MNDLGKGSAEATSEAEDLVVDPASARAKPLPRQLPMVRGPDAPGAGTVPARMINEVLYCERLLYLEYVQGEWADNVYTADGQAVHRRVNEQEKALKSPPEDAETNEVPPYVARSVSLSSEELGITAKIDLVEVDGGNVVPVEYKRGAKPDVPGGAYLPELAQVCAQVLLLREHGYSCDHGEIYYAKDRQRVELTIDEALIATTLGAVARARTVRVGSPPPAAPGQPQVPWLLARWHLFAR
jgi:CRISP-associated protein Cas1